MDGEEEFIYDDDDDKEEDRDASTMAHHTIFISFVSLFRYFLSHSNCMMAFLQPSTLR